MIDQIYQIESQVSQYAMRACNMDMLSMIRREMVMDIVYEMRKILGKPLLGRIEGVQ